MYVSLDVAKRLWDETKQRDWMALHKTLKTHEGRETGVDGQLIASLLETTALLAQGAVTYPSSAERLQEMLNYEIRKY